MPVRKPSPAELERSRVNAAGKLAASNDRITAGVLDLTTGQDWVDFLTFAARFRHFSFNNAMLIHQQAPDATYVAGYHVWTGLGGQVRRGEHGISLIAGDLIHGADAGTAATTSVMRPRNATVFDRAQVDPLDPAAPIAAVLAPPALAGPDTLGRLHAVLGDQLRDHIDRLRPAGVSSNPAPDARGEETTGQVDVASVAALAQLVAEAVLFDQRPDDPPLMQAVWTAQAAAAAHMVLAAQGVPADTLPALDHPARWARPVSGNDMDAYVDVVREAGNHAIFAARTILDRIEPAPTATAHQLHELAQRAQRSAAEAASAPPVGRPARATTAPRPHHVDLPLEAAAVERLGPIVAATLAYFTDFGRADIAHEYLAGRGITVPDGYTVGYAPVGGGLVQWLASHGFDQQLQVDAGVARLGRDDRVVDVFRDRIVFPISDGASLVGFTGRTARDSEIKYLNTPAVDGWFLKGRLLYGLTEGAQRLHAGATPVLVEGPMDALAIAQHRSNLVPIAAMGTAFTDRHVKALTDAVPVKRMILALDDDPAGRTAAIAAGEKLTAAGWTIRVPRPVQGKDPADISTEHGAKVIDWLDPRNCRPLIYLAAEHKVQSMGSLEWPEQRIQAADVSRAYLQTTFPNDPNLRRALGHAVQLCGLTLPEADESPPAQRPATHDRSPAQRGRAPVDAGYSR